MRRYRVEHAQTVHFDQDYQRMLRLRDNRDSLNASWNLKDEDITLWLRPKIRRVTKVNIIRVEWLQVSSPFQHSAEQSMQLSPVIVSL